MARQILVVPVCAATEDDGGARAKCAIDEEKWEKFGGGPVTRPECQVSVSRFTSWSLKASRGLSCSSTNASHANPSKLARLLEAFDANNSPLASLKCAPTGERASAQNSDCSSDALVLIVYVDFLYRVFACHGGKVTLKTRKQPC